MQNSFTVLKILCALPMHPPAPTPVLPSAPGNHWPFNCLHSWTIKKTECWRIDAFKLELERLSRVFPNTTFQFFHIQLTLCSNSHIHTWLLDKVLTRQNFVRKVMPLLVHMLSRLALAFLPRRKHLLILCPLSSSEVILKPPK